jgi:hypothetical protein
MSANYNKRVINVKPTSIAMLQGVFGAVMGLAAAILFTIGASLNIAETTNTVLGGLVLGIATGAVAIIVVPFIYFGIFWIIGLIQGFVLNFLIETSGGIEVSLKDTK